MGWRILWNLSAAVFACLVIGACVSIDRPRAKPLTKIEARSLPPKMLVDRTLDQLADILSTTVPDTDGVRPRNVLKFLWFDTNPRGTEIDGLCQHDSLIVDFGHKAEHSVDSDTPTRAVGVSATSYFLFLDPPQPRPAGYEEVVQKDLQEKCSKLSTDDVRFFAAESPSEAYSAISVLLQAIDELQSRPDELKIECDAYKLDCPSFFKDLRADNISSVASCKRLGAPGDCWSIQSSYSHAVEITTTSAGRQMQISSIKIQERLVLTHELID